MQQQQLLPAHALAQALCTSRLQVACSSCQQLAQGLQPPARPECQAS
jgi:hypothetical protein